MLRKVSEPKENRFDEINLQRVEDDSKKNPQSEKLRDRGDKTVLFLMKGPFFSCGTNQGRRKMAAGERERFHDLK